MGASAKTPYNPAWTEDEARAAFYIELGLPLPVEPATPPESHPLTPHISEQMS